MSSPTLLVPPRIERISRTHEVSIAAPAERVFALTSPAGEYEWIEGWSCQMVYPPSGAMEEGCIFRERLSGPLLVGWPVGPTTWVVNRHSTATLEEEFHVFFARAALGRQKVTVRRTGSDSCALSIEFTLTALDERANRLVMRPATARKVEGMVSYLGESLKHYCETGTMLDRYGFLRRRGLRHGPVIHGWLRRLGLA
jgi:hypothetical protein